MPSVQVLTFVTFPCSLSLSTPSALNLQDREQQDPAASPPRSKHAWALSGHLLGPPSGVCEDGTLGASCEKPVELSAQTQQRLHTLLHTTWGGCSSGTSVFISADKRVFVVGKLSLPPVIPAQDFTVSSAPEPPCSFQLPHW